MPDEEATNTAPKDATRTVTWRVLRAIGDVGAGVLIGMCCDAKEWWLASGLLAMVAIDIVREFGGSL